MFVFPETKVELKDLEVTCQGSPALSSQDSCIVAQISPAICGDPFPELSCGTFWKNKWALLSGERGIEQSAF